MSIRVVPLLLAESDRAVLDGWVRASTVESGFALTRHTSTSQGQNAASSQAVCRRLLSWRPRHHESEMWSHLSNEIWRSRH